MKRPATESYVMILSRDPNVLQIGEIWSEQFMINWMKTDTWWVLKTGLQEKKFCYLLYGKKKLLNSKFSYENFSPKRNMKFIPRLQILLWKFYKTSNGIKISIQVLFSGMFSPINGESSLGPGFHLKTQWLKKRLRFHWVSTKGDQSAAEFPRDHLILQILICQ